MAGENGLGQLVNPFSLGRNQQNLTLRTDQVPTIPKVVGTEPSMRTSGQWRSSMNLHWVVCRGMY